MIDVLSHGRLDAGFVRGVPYEFAGEQQSSADERAALGGARSDREGLDHARRPVQSRGPLFPSTAPSTSGRGRSSSRIRRSGSAPPARVALLPSARAATFKQRS